MLEALKPIKTKQPYKTMKEENTIMKSSAGSWKNISGNFAEHFNRMPFVNAFYVQTIY